MSTVLLNFELPCLQGVDPETLMEVRKSEGEAFQAFRDDLESRLLPLKTGGDPEKLRLKVEAAYHEISEVRVRAIQRQITSLWKKALAEAGLLAGSLVGAVSTGGLSLLTGALAAFQGYKTYSDYYQKVRSNPSFFLYRVKQ